MRERIKQAVLEFKRAVSQGAVFYSPAEPMPTNASSGICHDVEEARLAPLEEHIHAFIDRWYKHIAKARRHISAQEAQGAEHGCSKTPSITTCTLPSVGSSSTVTYADGVAACMARRQPTERRVSSFTVRAWNFSIGHLGASKIHDRRGRPTRCCKLNGLPSSVVPKKDQASAGKIGL